MPVEITLADGSKIVGENAEEALKSAAKQLEDTKAAYRDVNGKLEDLTGTVEQLRTAETERQQAATRAAQEAANRKKAEETGWDNAHYIRLLNEDAEKANDYAMRHYFKKTFNADPEQIAQQFTNTTNTVSRLHQESIASAFAIMHPDYPVGDAAAAKALNVAVTALTNQGYPFDVTTLDFAYQSLVREGKIKPMELTTKDDTTEPPPNLSGAGAGGSTANQVDWDKMDDKTLEAELRKAGALR
jgi:ADP-ribose pyrophosphatase YjhB (NUDIX family)